MFRAVLSRLAARLAARAFLQDGRGNVAIIVALAAVPVFGVVGLAIDYGYTVNVRSRLDGMAHAAALEGIAYARSSLSQTSMDDANNTQVAQSNGQSVAFKVFNNLLSAVPNAQINNAFASVTRVGATFNASFTYSVSVPTTLSQILGVSTLSFTSTIKETGAFPDDVAPVAPYLINEGFESMAAYTDKGGLGVFENYNSWVTQPPGCGLELGPAAGYGTTAPEGSRIVDLDRLCNAAMSKKVYMNSGSYELRYWYKSRMPNSKYDPIWICASVASDIDAFYATPVDQTARVGVYLDPALSNVPPSSFLPTTNNVIDICMTSAKWIERSVHITINVPGFYWLTFQGEGKSDGAGSLIDSIRLCTGTCPGTPADNFPWAKNSWLWDDNFKWRYVPSTYASGYPGTPGQNVLWFNGTLDKDPVDTAWASATTMPQTNWVISPVNQMDMQDDLGWGTGCGGTFPYCGMAIELNATPGSRTLSRRLLLDPGYYEIGSMYASRAQVPELGPGPTCGTSPAAVSASAFTNVYDYNKYTEANTSWASTHFSAGGSSGTSLAHTEKGNFRYDVNQMSFFMDSDRLVSHPVGSPDFFGATTWVDPDGRAQTLPQVPQNVIETCLNSTAWSLRAHWIKITKPGYYWVSWRAEGQGGAFGPIIASPYVYARSGLSAPPWGEGGYMTIPTAAPAAGATIPLNLMSIIAN